MLENRIYLFNLLANHPLFTHYDIITMITLSVGWDVLKMVPRVNDNSPLDAEKTVSLDFEED